jgi:hypothetical protein
LVAVGAATVFVAAAAAMVFVAAAGAMIVGAAEVLVASPPLLPLLRPQAERTSNAINAVTEYRATRLRRPVLIDHFPQTIGATCLTNRRYAG